MHSVQKTLNPNFRLCIFEAQIFTLNTNQLNFQYIQQVFIETLLILLEWL